MKLFVPLFTALTFFSISGFSQTATFNTQVCQTKSDGILDLDRNKWAYDNNEINEAYNHDFPPINAVIPCGNAVLTALVFTFDLISVTDNTDGSTCDWDGVHVNLYSDCSGICDVNQQMNGGCDNWVSGYTSTGIYTMDLLDCPRTPFPTINSILNVDLVSSMRWGAPFDSCPCNGSSITDSKAIFNYTICIDYEYEAPLQPVAVASSNSPVCDGETIELMASGGQSYEWDGPGGFSETGDSPQIFDATDLESGTYTVTVTGEPGCEDITTINVVVAPPVEVTVDNSTDPTCYGFSNGTAMASATGGVNTTYTYEWTPGFFNGAAQNTLDGNVDYTISVTDGAGCSGTIDLFLDEPDEMIITVDGTDNPSCFGINDGAASVFTDGGDNISYTYFWTPGGFTGDFVDMLSGDIVYTVESTDGNGCMASETILLTEPDSIGINFLKIESPKCFGDTTGLVIVEGSGGNGFFDYDWSNGIQIDTVDNLLPDSTYGITVTDLNGCLTDDTIRLSSPPPINLSLAASTDPDCGGANGTAAVAASGGMGDLTYIWQPSGITDSTATGLSGGVPYTVTAIDTNNCSKQLVVTLRNAPAFTTLIGATTDPSCPDKADGTASVSTSGGQGPFNILWSSGAVGMTASNLMGDSTYFVTVLDANSCEVVDTVRLTNPQLLVANIRNPTDPSCNGSGDGFASVLIAGGTGTNFMVNWTPGNQTSLTAVGLSGGITYTVSVTDDKNCSTTSSVTLTEPAPVIAEITGDTIFCPSDTRSLSANAGYPTYSWSNSVNTQNITVSNTGTYILTVTDAVGCKGVDSVIVNHYPAIVPQIQGSTSFCTGTSTTLELAGYANYTWSSGGIDSFIMVNTPGEVTVETVDGNGCVGRDTVMISESSSLNPTIGGALSFCEGDSTALSAGSGFATYNWSNSAGSNVVDITMPGTYSVTVSDIAGCSGSDTVVVVQNANPTLSILGAADFCEGDTIQLSANDVFPTYVWNGTPGGQTINALNGGNYTLSITDDNGCVADAAVSVNFLPTPSVDILGDNAFCEGDTIQIDAGANFSSYTWNTGAGSQSLEVTQAGDYIVNIEDANGCKNADTLSVSTFSTPIPAIDNVADFCEGDSIELTVSGGVFSQFDWSDNSQNSTLTVTDGGVYFLTITDANGCEGNAFANISTFPSPFVDVSGSTTFCTGNSTTLDAGFGFANYDWSNGSSDQSIMVSTPGFLEVIVTDLNGCKATDTLTVSESASLAPNIVGSLEFCEGDSTVLDAGSGFTTYEWSNSDNSQNITISESGQVILTVFDNSGCSGKDTVQVTEFQSVTPTELTPNICTGQVFTVGTNDYSATGMYRDTFQNLNGCDSVVITDLLVSAALEEMVPIQICLGDSLFVGGDFQDQQGTYRDTIQSIGGCDSIVITSLSLASAIEQTIPVEICPGMSHFAGGAMQTMAGMYRDTFQSVGGCDSIAITNLSFSLPIEETTPVEICPGMSHFAGGAMQTTAGMYRDTFQTLAGCDSIAITNLSFSPMTEVLSTRTICKGDSIFSAGAWQFDTGIYSEVQSTLGECDTLFTLDLTVEACAATIQIETTPASCFGDGDGTVTFSLTTALNDVFVFNIENSNTGVTSNGNITSNSQEVTVENLEAGNYTLQVFSRWGDLEIDETFAIDQPDELVASTASNTPPTCSGDSDGIVQVAATGGTPNYIFSWQNGFTGNERTDLSPGDYAVFLTDNNGCKDTVEFSVVAPDPVFAEANPSGASCAGNDDGSIEIGNTSGGAGGYMFSFDGMPFSAQNLYENLEPRGYDIIVQDAKGCEFLIENIQVQNGGGLNIILPADLTLVPGAEVTLSPDLDFTPTQIEWTPIENLSCGDCLEPTLTASLATTYTITAFASDNCFATASINILIDDSGRDAFMPSGFSPNDDGINDIFYVNAGDQIVNVKNFSVLDRWGNLMFQRKDILPNDATNGWDGKYRGKRMDSGVYVFFAEVEFADGSTEILEGDVTIVGEK